MDVLFFDADNNYYSSEDVRRALIETGAADCETLFIHADVMFGRPPEGFRRKEYLAVLYEIIASLGVRNLIVPTFTYSFCNHECYDIVNSKTSMGAFNEYIRKLPGRYRTFDPLLSVSVPAHMETQFNHVSDHSLGEGSALDILHHMDGVKFLFFGAEMAECFTYVHYVEKMLDVPYRFDMPFEGEIILPDRSTVQRKQFIHTQCGGVRLPPKYTYFEAEMEERGFLKKKRLADKYIACLSEPDAYREIKGHIEDNIYYFLEVPYEKSQLTHCYTYSTDKGRITHC